MPAAAHEPEEVQSKFFWGSCFGNVRPFCSAAYRLPEIYGCQGTLLSWSLSILSVLLRKVLPTNVILQLICKRRESHPVFKPDFIDVQIKFFEEMLSQGGGKIVADGGLNAQVWTSSPGACSYKDFACRLHRLSVRRFMKSCGSWEQCCYNCGFFWSNSNDFIPSTIGSVLLGQLWV